MSKKKAKQLDFMVAVADQPERQLTKNASPWIATDKCLDCGTCIVSCPTGAIREMQRQICRLCPDCAEGAIMFPSGMEELATHACSDGCPLGHYPEGYIGLVAKGDWEGAWDVISAINPLPGVLGRICSRPCEDECKRGILIDKPMHIRATKRAVADWAEANGKAVAKTYQRNIDMRVAVIGGGPAGLTAASDLAAKGYRVTIFEKTGNMGGMIRRVIPEFRLPDGIWQDEFERALGDGGSDGDGSNGIDVKFGVSVGTTVTLDDLLEDGFRAIILAVGTPNGKKLPIPGQNFKGVYDALHYMNDVKYKIPIETGENVVVVGGGSVATDVARTALRKGADKVTMVCVEDEKTMPAFSWEVDEARAEGVEILAGYAPLSINSKWMRAETITLAKVKSLKTKDNGQLDIKLDDKTTKDLEAQTVIFAVGQAPDVPLLERMGLERNESGGIVQDASTLATSKKGVYAAGDLTGGACSVVSAMASARKAAKSVDAYLQKCTPAADVPGKGVAPLSEKIFPVRLEKLTPMKLTELGKEAALAGYDEVQDYIDWDELQTDSRRCMRCGYIEVDHAICVGCGTCRTVCPTGDVITMGAPLTGGEKE